jgi:hypothetical protein
MTHRLRTVQILLYRQPAYAQLTRHPADTLPFNQNLVSYDVYLIHPQHPLPPARSPQKGASAVPKFKASGGSLLQRRLDQFFSVVTISDLLGAKDGEEEHKRVWESRSQIAREADPAQRKGTLLPARGIHYIPGTGWLSPGFINLGDNRFLGALVEIKHPRIAGQEQVGYARSDALAGMEPRPGCVHLLENDRVRVYETTLDPGQSDQMREQLDAGIYVIDGGRLRIVEEDESGKRSSVEQEHASVSGYFLPGGVRRQITNIGTTRYRQLSVEVK